MLFKFESLKTKKDGSFTSLTKLINKFTASLVKKGLLNISVSSTFATFSEIEDKYKTLLSKVREFLTASCAIK